MNKFKCFALSVCLLFSSISLFSMELIFPKYLSSNDFEEAITLLQGSTLDDSDGILNDYDIIKIIKILKKIRLNKCFKDLYVKNENNELILRTNSNFSPNNQRFEELNKYYNAKLTWPFINQCIIKFKRPIDIFRVKEIYSSDQIPGIESIQISAPKILKNDKFKIKDRIYFKIEDGIWIFFKVDPINLKISYVIAKYNPELCILTMHESLTPLQAVGLVPYYNHPKFC